MFNDFFFFENRTVYDIISKNAVQPEGSQMTSEYGAYDLHAGSARLHARMRMCTPTLRSASARTHRYVILISFPRQQWLREWASLLAYSYIACLVIYCYLYVSTTTVKYEHAIEVPRMASIQFTVCWNVRV